MDFQTALNNVLADLTPQPWDWTADDGTTLRVIPAGLRADKGSAEVNIRVTRADATGLGDYGITGPNSRGVAEVGVPTRLLPDLIQALSDGESWADNALIAGTLLVTVKACAILVAVTEVHGPGCQVAVDVTLPEAQRLPLASALGRALDVAKSWEG
jgi:hypothetical protein